MPATSKAQQRYMGMCSTPAGRKKAKGKCPPMSVAKKYARSPKDGKLREKAKSRGL